MRGSLSFPLLSPVKTARSPSSTRPSCPHGCDCSRATAGVTSVSVVGDTVNALPVMVSSKSVFGEAPLPPSRWPPPRLRPCRGHAAVLPANHELLCNRLLGPAWPAIYAPCLAIHNDYLVIEGLSPSNLDHSITLEYNA